MTTALITGTTGQDGSYLAELLVAGGTRVLGMVRRAGDESHPHLAAVRGRWTPVVGDLGDAASLERIIADHRPDEVYHLAAVTKVGQSWTDPAGTGDSTALGTVRLLEAVRRHAPAARFFHAGSSEAYGRPAAVPQDESTPFHPRTPYGAAKQYACRMVVLYREAHGLFACNGILFNHESPRRGEAFLTGKVAAAVARIAAGRQDRVQLGNLRARRDWGFAGDTVRAMVMMLRRDRAEDFVIGTGVQHTVEDLCAAAFAAAGLDWRRHVVSEASLMRPDEADNLVADPTRAREVLGWRPEVAFDGLIRMLVGAAMESETGEVQSPKHGA